MSKIIVNEIESKNTTTTPVGVNCDLNVAANKVYKINNSTVLTATQVHGKTMPTGTIVGHNDEQTLYSKTLAGFTLSNDITINAAVDIDLYNNNASAISFDSTNKSGILEIVTTTNSEKVKMSGGLEVTGSLTAKGLAYPTTDGTDGQVLTTNGSGVLTFNSVSAGNNPVTLNLENSNSTINLSLYKTTSFRIKNPAQITLSNGTNGVWYTFVIVSDGSYSFTSEIRFPLNNSQPVASASGSVDVYSFHCVNTTSGLKYLATFAYDYSEVVI
jgi:hypothetical protein